MSVFIIISTEPVLYTTFLDRREENHIYTYYQIFEKLQYPCCSLDLEVNSGVDHIAELGEYSK
jgi:hypothetical protein